MSVVLPLVFTVAAIAAVLTIWTSVKAALPAIARLRAQLRETSADRIISVRVLDSRKTGPADSDGRLAGGRRRPHPKPYPHRLHRFASPVHAA